MITKEEKQVLIKKFGATEQDTGSAKVQIAILTARIIQLNKHFQTHKKDNQSKRGLLQLVGARRSLLNYLKRTSPKSYEEILTALSLRK